MVTVMEPEPHVIAVADRIDALFVDMPGLLLTAGQIRRLLDVPRPQCEGALQYLVEMDHLVREEDGQYRPRFRPMPFGTGAANGRPAPRYGRWGGTRR